MSGADPSSPVGAGLALLASAPLDVATRGYWLAARMAPHVNAAPAQAAMALQTLAILAAARSDRVGDAAAALFKRVTGREVERPQPLFDPDDFLPPAA